MARMVHFFKKNKIPMAGKPFVYYDKYNVANDFATISICIPVRQQISVSDGSDMTSGEIIAFTCLKTTLIGDYSHSKEAWAKAKKYIANNGLKENLAGSYSEIYVKTIDDIKQPSKWITEIYIPVFPKVITLTEPIIATIKPAVATSQTTISSTETP
jgi:effector-binding domain-containing protein